MPIIINGTNKMNIIYYILVINIFIIQEWKPINNQN